MDLSCLDGPVAAYRKRYLRELFPRAVITVTAQKIILANRDGWLRSLDTDHGKTMDFLRRARAATLNGIVTTIKVIPADICGPHTFAASLIGATLVVDSQYFALAFQHKVENLSDRGSVEMNGQVGYLTAAAEGLLAVRERANPHPKFPYDPESS